MSMKEMCIMLMQSNGGQVGRMPGESEQASGPHLDLDHAPYALYGVKYIDLVSLAN